MSRIENKKFQKKRSNYKKITMILILCILIFGILTVDYVLIDTLAIDDSKIINYKEVNRSQYILYIFEKELHIDLAVLMGKINNKFADIGEIAYNVKEYIVNFLK